MAAASPKELRYRLPHLDNVEDVEKYTKGGFHPIHLGDTLKGGRYCVLHKLGYGGFSTVWLARDKFQDRLVSLKVLTAEASRLHKELGVLRHLDERVRADPLRASIIATLDDFTIDGPNSTHLCYVSQPGGPVGIRHLQPYYAWHVLQVVLRFIDEQSSRHQFHQVMSPI